MSLFNSAFGKSMSHFKQNAGNFVKHGANKFLHSPFSNILAVTNPLAMAGLISKRAHDAHKNHKKFGFKQALGFK